VVTPTGLTLPVLADRGDGTYEVQTPCSETAVVSGTPLSGAHVVLDPGHGGDEPGAVGPNGLAEKELNLAVARLVADALRAQGATVVLTRDQDVRLTLSTRALTATNLAPVAFVSIHHNADPDGPSPVPGTEVYFQVASDPSRRLAGLIVEEVRAALGQYDADWVSDVPNGAVARITTRDGGDFYGILRRGGATTTVLSEAAYLSNPTEADLLARPDVQQAEAEAIARAIERFQRGESAAAATYAPGGPLTQPSGGPGGGSRGCVDPPLA
jgi:N-acetylmuramoyl-L-alanine amidase